MFAWMLIPIFEKIEAKLEKSGDFDALQNFRLSVVFYYLKHDPRLKHFKLGEIAKGVFAFDLTLRYFVQREESLKQKCHRFVRGVIGVMNEDFTNWNPRFQPGHFVGLMIPTGRILNGISILISGTTAQEEVDAAAVSAVAVKNANQPPKDPGILVTVL
ncbi:hypothetical protein LT330_010403 [Penicillium expansum]|nr:hypothetical protein LT330_010403 [Penicillium expansum]